MPFNLLFLCLITLLWSSAAQADQAEAKEVARLYDCAPKKIEVYQDSLGSNGKVTYQVTCNLPKTTSTEDSAGPDALLIECDQSLCELVRPIASEKK